MPVSETRTSTSAPDVARTTSTRPPAEVNLMALVRRFHTSCCRRMASPSTGGVAPSIELRTVIPFASAAGVIESVVISMIGPRSTRRVSSRSLPVTMRDTSSRSSTIRVWAFTFRSIASMARAAPSASRPPRRSIQTHDSIALRGVRSS